MIETVQWFPSYFPMAFAPENPKTRQLAGKCILNLRIISPSDVID